jgi:hypothetical protein
MASTPARYKISGACCLRFDISDLLRVEDQQTANRNLCQCPNFGGGSSIVECLCRWQLGGRQAEVAVEEDRPLDGRDHQAATRQRASRFCHAGGSFVERTFA